MKRVELVSLLIGLSISAIPAHGAFNSQSGHQDFKKPDPIVYEADPNDFQFEQVNNTLTEQSSPVDDGIPEELAEVAERIGQRFHISPELIEAIAEHESHFDYEALSDTSTEHSVGIMQINLKCSAHQERLIKYSLTEEDMNNVDYSVLIACDILKELFEDYEDVGEVLIRYNGDRTGLKEYKRSGTLSTYASEILKRTEELEEIHGKK